MLTLPWVKKKTWWKFHEPERPIYTTGSHTLGRRGYRKALAEYSPNVRRLPSCRHEGERRISSVFSGQAGRRSPNFRRIFVLRLPDSPEGARFDRTTRKALASDSTQQRRLYVPDVYLRAPMHCWVLITAVYFTPPFIHSVVYTCLMFILGRQ